jgi:uncharacterized membrane protein YcaP (DUF421 family)
LFHKDIAPRCAPGFVLRSNRLRNGQRITGIFEQLFYHDWLSLVRTAVGTTVTYVALIILLRVAGQRTLAKWYAFVLIVTVALGSTFANRALSKDVTIAQSVLGFVILVTLQFATAWIIVRKGKFRIVVNPTPALLVRNGQFQQDVMVRHRVDEADVRAAVRGKGVGGLEQVAAVVLEPDGTFSVIRDFGSSSRSAMVDVAGFGKR